MIDVIIINLNCLDHTKNIIDDLRRQTFKQFDVTVLDQNSIEAGTHEFLDELRNDTVLNPTVIRHNRNIPLNRLWNAYVHTSVHPILCLLNNDIRIPSNFLLDVANIFESDDTIGAVMHPTNHPQYRKIMPETKYEILERGKYRQGWDICIRKDAWTDIPENLTIYCGDDFVFENMYARGYNSAMAVSSPIIHYLGQTRKSKHNENLPERNPKQDVSNYRALGYVHHMVPPVEYTIVDFTQSPVNFIEEL
jgi:GT2 family glycosyltransferase